MTTKYPKDQRFWKGVIWIAQNDNAGNGDTPADIAGYISTLLLADLWNIDEKLVAQAIVSARLKLNIAVSHSGSSAAKILEGRV